MCAREMLPTEAHHHHRRQHHQPLSSSSPISAIKEDEGDGTGPVDASNATTTDDVTPSSLNRHRHLDQSPSSLTPPPPPSTTITPPMNKKRNTREQKEQQSLRVQLTRFSRRRVVRESVQSEKKIHGRNVGD